MMSEDKKKKVAKQSFYFLRGFKPSIIYGIKEKRVILQCNKKGIFITKSRKMVRILQSKGYEEISKKNVKGN